MKFIQKISLIIIPVLFLGVVNNALASTTVETKNATNISTTSASLNGFDILVTNALISGAGRGFEYGINTNYGQTAMVTDSYVTDFGSYGSGNGQFIGSFGITTDQNDNVYVTETSGHRIQKFDSNGNYILQFGTLGSGNGQLNNPQDLVVDMFGNIYVTDFLNHRIQKFDSNGNYILQFGSYGSGNGQFKFPHAIALDSFGNVYVGDSNNNRIQKFDSNGNYILQFGSYGSGNGQFFNFSDFEISNDGVIYVVDSGNYRVQKFNLDGNYQSHFALPHNDPADTFNYIVLDSDGNLYLTRANLGLIVKFSASGDYVSDFSPGAGFTVVTKRIAKNSKNDIYLVGSNFVRKFKRDFSVNIGSLACGTTYHFRAFVENAFGVRFYGQDKTFKTQYCISSLKPSKQEPTSPANPPRPVIVDKKEEKKPTDRPTIISGTKIETQTATAINSLESKETKNIETSKETQVKTIK